MKITLNPISLLDSDLLFQWRNTPEIYMLGTTKRPVSIEEHTQWLNQAISDNQSYHYIINYDGSNCGQIRLVYGDKHSYKISIFLLSQYRSCHVGSRALDCIFDGIVEKGSNIIAEILKENTKSINFFIKNGFGLEKEDNTHIILKRVV